MNNQRIKKKPSPVLWLLLIPAQLVLDVILFWLAVFVDTAILPDPNALGHPAPALTLISVIVLPVITIIVGIIAIILMAIGLAIQSKRDEAERIALNQNVYNPRTGVAMTNVDYYINCVLRPDRPLETCRNDFMQFSLEEDERIYYFIAGNGYYNQIANLLRTIIEEKKNI